MIRFIFVNGFFILIAIAIFNFNRIDEWKSEAYIVSK